MLVDSHCHLDFPDFAADTRRRHGARRRRPASADGDDLDTRETLFHIRAIAEQL
jgi:Tat protein secretion system quality control protein TatD with DNase activity